MLVFSDKQPGDQGPVRSTWGWGGGVVGGGGDGVGGRRAAAVIETVAGGSCFAPCGSCIGPREASHDCDLTYVSAGCECASLVALALLHVVFPFHGPLCRCASRRRTSTEATPRQAGRLASCSRCCSSPYMFLWLGLLGWGVASVECTHACTHARQSIGA